MTEKLRIRISQIVAGLLVVLICVSSSLSEDKAPFVTTVLFLSGAILVVILIAFVGYYPLVIKSEEVELLKRRKSEFENYLKKVPTFFAKISLLNEPEEYMVKPIIYKKHMFHALWFIWFLGIIELIEELHELGVFPTLFKIY